ncbi:hypothetical protein AB1Y20_014117 [Prymnesium parvum]|uniref:Dynein-1, subspecies f n=1 Tax=Prymnesium parvum TaxID=97485 RepID=A0AB34IIE7_PRYPA
MVAAAHEPLPDPCYSWLEGWVVIKLGVKPEKFRKLVSNDEASRPIQNFIENPECTRLLVSLRDKAELVCAELPHAPIKAKTACFVKLERQALRGETVDALVMPMDLLPDSLLQLYRTCQETFLPMLVNPENQAGWPSVVAQEVLDHFQRLTAGVYVTMGQLHGKTLLPLPPIDNSSPDKAAREKDRVHAYETAVVTWTRQIKNVLKAEPDHILKTNLHPGPMYELDFWANKSTNLSSIEAQLEGDKMLKVLRVLELTKSTYYQSFTRLMNEVTTAAIEAESNITFLNTLKDDLEDMEAVAPSELVELIPLFRPFLHRCMLIWKHSQFYNTPARLVVLLREMCNLLMDKARTFIDGNEIFNLPPNESLGRLMTALKVCGTFKSIYYEYKAASETDVPKNAWRFQSNALFARLDAFLERCHDLKELCKTVLQFERLEKIEIGGNKGRTLSASVAQMHADFQRVLERMTAADYDVLNIEMKQFDDDFYTFRSEIKQLERRLASILNQGFDDCTTVFAAFKLMESFDGLLERDLLQSDLRRNESELIEGYAQDLRDVQQIFHQQKDISAAGRYLERKGPPLFHNFPPVAGSCFWVRGLKERIELPMVKLRQSMKQLLESDEAQDVVRGYNSLLATLGEFEKAQFTAWGATVEETSQSKLRQPLLTREEDVNSPRYHLLSVNFDPALVSLLREVKYFEILGIAVPASAAELNKSVELFRVLIGNLELIVGKYNQILLTLLDVERPLLAAHLRTIDSILEQGLHHLSWRSHGVDIFVKEAMTQVTQAHSKLMTLKENMAAVQAVLDGWARAPLMRRKTTQTYLLSDWEEAHKPHLSARYSEIAEGGKEIHKLMLASNRELKVSKGAPAWKSYVEYVNDVVTDGLARVVAGSLKFVCENIDPAEIAHQELVPLLEVQLELRPPAVQFSPPLLGGEGASKSSIMGVVEGWIKDFYWACHLVKRLDRPDGDFWAEVIEKEEVRYLVHKIHRFVRLNAEECNAFREPFLAHQSLWHSDLSVALSEFLETRGRRQLSPTLDESEARLAPRTVTRLPLNPNTARGRLLLEPSLAEFDKQIGHYKALQDSISAMPVTTTRGWLKLDAKPAKQALSTWVTKWMFAFTQHLQDNVVNALYEIETFMREVQEGLSLDRESVREDKLTEAMTHIQNVRESDNEIEEIFEPLRGAVAMLKRYGIMISDQAKDLLERCPFEWEDTRKLAAAARERLAPLQVQQAENVKKDANQFEVRITAYVAEFYAKAPFHSDEAADVYEELDRWNERTQQVEEEAAAFQRREKLFELNVHTFKEVSLCRASLLDLKTVWDHVHLVESIFSAWKLTTWANLNCEAWYLHAKQLQGHVKSIERTVRNVSKWGVFTTLMRTISDMLVTLPLVQDLHDEAMRERHWKKLMRACGRTFVLDAKFCLNDLVKLQLHRYADAVSEIVEQARQELKIDKQLDRIENTWANLMLEFVSFKSSGVGVLDEASLGPVFEALDENEVSLQTMMVNRFMGHFETKIASWRTRLSSVRATLDVWLEVQRSWCSLEAIFVLSEDIREQLPEDSKRFDVVDAEFKEQMAEASTTANPIDACLKEGRHDTLCRCHAALELCNRSLTDYLETKRKRFPRFYFISSADLVDILSKGKYPPSVQEHFSKFTDNIGAIEWEEDDGEHMGVAIGMFSGEGEHVPFSSTVRCEGPVEDWLMGLMEYCSETLKERLVECINTRVELPLEKWVLESCAQLAITSSQIWWTQEVNAAFALLEQGNATALKDYGQVIGNSLTTYATMVLGELSRGDRTKVKTMITIEVHMRDAVTRLVQEKVESASSFAWQSNLKYRWDEYVRDCFINICDAEFRYSYEYVGNCGRLVITALTDRCYITLTQALRLVLGGAPAGPAGTGKTETTKDLGRGLAIWVVVQNCSDQMTAKSMANTFSGLAQTGAWGCFDEFNRIPVEVLSVAAGQFGSVLDAVRSGKERFLFEEDEIWLKPTVGAFITMNPGYAGRTELPENLKALFRGCAMVVPDFENIIEIELSAEGFLDAKNLAHKFITLFMLSKELLSKQPHYDWGLRAIKGVLRIAGGMKRGEPEKQEVQVLMRALRDTNLPKFSVADVGVFLGLINDLFPRVASPKTIDPTLSEAVLQLLKNPSCPLQPDEGFISKTVALAEVLSVRHCVFVLGAAGSGKTQVWQTLAQAQTRLQFGGGRTLYGTINPKAVTSNDLYGYVHPVTKELNDGIIAKMMREFSKMTTQAPKWVVLDGDIDAEWIESMNTVMDDNKVLTLVSNERIPLTASMRLLFEISHMRNASPATASRGGVLYLNESDVGWWPYVQTWIDGSEFIAAIDPSHAGTNKLLLEQLFEQFVPECLEWQRGVKPAFVTPLKDFAMVETLCSILSGTLSASHVPPDTEKEAIKLTIEASFQVACIWAFGGALTADRATDYRRQFSEWWRAEFYKTPVKFLDGGLVFDQYFNLETHKMAHWRERVSSYTHIKELPVSAIVVPTMDTTRLTYFIDSLMRQHTPVMLVGNAGTAKTTIFNDKLRSLPDEMISFSMNFNSYSDSTSLQFMLEQPLEKKTGSIYGPPGTKRLVYFIDDFNMPLPDKYGTQSAIALLRQQIDYGGFYDLKKLSMRTIQNVQYMGAMNPTAGSFTIIDRMQRHFATFACLFPEAEVLNSIYLSIVQGHLSNFSHELVRMAETIVNATLGLHKDVVESFLPTAVRFHYQWNLRELSAVFGGIVLCTPEYYNRPMQLARLWLHEVYRVYGDRLTNENDCLRFDEITARYTKTFFEDLDQIELHSAPLIFSSFALAKSSDEKIYLNIDSYDKLKRILQTKLNEHNESNARMDLVLFEQAMEHVTRISRIIDSPRGNALLVGVGGSGKQSLTRLAAYIENFAIFQIKLTSVYSMIDFKADLVSLYYRAGLRGEQVVLLFTDQQIVHERMLVYFNDMLSSGSIPDLYTQEEKDNIINSIRPELKAAGIMDSIDNCWEYYIDKVRRNLHTVLCMSPVGSAFRIRCRKFPAITSCTVINWFHPWPAEALISVATRFLEGVEVPDEVRENVTHHMAFVHLSVNKACEKYLAQERRSVYTTPKSYLELIALYKKLLISKTANLGTLQRRLETGLIKLRSSAEQVVGMQIQLKEEQVVVEQKKSETDELLVQVGQESAIADEQAEVAAVEEEKVVAVQKDVSIFTSQCQADLAAAEPAIRKAEAALNGLDKTSLTELKSLTTPPKEVLSVTAAVMYMLAKKGTNLKKLDVSWTAAKKVMTDISVFLASLQKFDRDNFIPENKEMVRKITGPPENPDPSFNYDSMKSKSVAAAGLCDWVVNICCYHDIFLEVEPKRRKLAEAEAKLLDANRKLQVVRDKVAVLEERKQGLQEQLVSATEEKNRLLEQAAMTAKRLNLAERLVNGLKDENERWAMGVESLKEQKTLLVGDVMVAASFIAYIGPFSEQFRAMLLANTWLVDLSERNIPSSEGIDPLHLLTDEATIAGWQRQGLPADRLSLENGAIISNCTRYPLIIDPQLQGIRWLREREVSNGLLMTQLSRKNYLDTVHLAMSEGLPLLIENLGETVDAVLNPVIARAVMSKGRKIVIRLGDEEVDMHTLKDEQGNATDKVLFTLYLQTKLPNPHYIPELQAQLSLINFTVTEKGLEDQLLAVVVHKERADLEEQRSAIVQQQNEFTIRLKELEDDLLQRLANAEGDVLGNEELILSLENTKATVAEISRKKEAANATFDQVAEARETYRPIATRGSLIYFLLDQLHIIDHMYQYSLSAFNFIFDKSLVHAEPAEALAARCSSLLSSVTYTCFAYVMRGLFERHRLIFSLQLGCRILMEAGLLQQEEVDMLVRAPRIQSENPLSQWLSDSSWQSICALGSFEAFQNLRVDIEGAPKRWRDWCEHTQPENEPLPAEWKRLSPFERLLVIRAIRPDRMTLAVSLWVKEVLGPRFVEAVPFDLAAAFEDSSPETPIFFLLSPGVNVPQKSVRELGKRFDITDERFVAVSLGQGQEPVAEKALELMHATGGWVMLQNIELVASWLPKLEKKLEALCDGAHPRFRVFLSSLPQKVVPVQVLQSSIKLTNEPPSGLKANMLRAYNSFSESVWETCSKQGELKSIIFALCFFHSVVCERRKFGPIGWNLMYPFNPGDLTVCITVAYNYLEASPKVPWDDLRYIFGEIMYGGHITDAWDRRLCNTYLKSFLKEELLDSLQLFPKFDVPSSALSYKQYLEYIEEQLAAETPSAFGMHSNSEMNFMMRQADELFSAVAELQPRAANAASGMSLQERVKRLLDDIQDRLPGMLHTADIEHAMGDDRTPFGVVFLQECERMNMLLFEISRALLELDMGLKGDLSISEAMETLTEALYDDRVPRSWAARAWPSLQPLAAWLVNLRDRSRQLAEWAVDLVTPKVTWLSGLFNPQAFLTAVMQATARKNEWPLDKLVTVVEVTRRALEDVETATRDGAYIHGLFLEGARWDISAGVLDDAQVKQLYPPMPVILIKAVTQEKAAALYDVYQCPVYQTEMRGPTYVFDAGLRTKANPAKWTLAGVALIMDVSS